MLKSTTSRPLKSSSFTLIFSIEAPFFSLPNLFLIIFLTDPLSKSPAMIKDILLGT